MEQKKMKATERLELLETSLISVIEKTNPAIKRVGELELIVYNISRENTILKEALTLVHEKLDAVIGLSNSGEALSDENIQKNVIDAKVKAMSDKVKEQFDLGNLELGEVVDAKSFIVARELNKNGTVENPRLQFLMGQLVEELQNKFVGKKTGELVTTPEEDKLDIEIMEIYNIIEKEEAPVEEAVEVVEAEVIKPKAKAKKAAKKTKE